MSAVAAAPARGRLLDAMRRRTASPAPGIPRREDPRTAPLSYSQERLWFLHQLDPSSSAYHIVTPFRLTGAVDPGHLDRCLRALRQRHEILRTTFPLAAGQPEQRIAPPSDESILEVMDAPEDWRAALDAHAQRPFDLETGPLLRAALFRLGAREYAGHITMHHIVSDGWSSEIFFRELAALASGHAALPALPVQYGDFAVWQRRSGFSSLDFWKRTMQGAPALLELPLDRPRGAATFSPGARESVEVGAELTGRLRELSRREGATLFMTLLAAFAATLSRYAGQRDIVIGTPVANRNRSELEPLIGLLMNTIALRIRLADGITFRGLLKAVRENALEAFAHQDLPFDKLIEELKPERNAGHAPFAQTLFVLQQAAGAPLQLPGMLLEPLAAPCGQAKNDLALYVEDRGGCLSASLEYNTALFDAASIRQMLSSWKLLLEAGPDARIDDAPILEPGHRATILEHWNASATEWPQGGCVHTLIERQARLTPQAVAVEFEGREITYAQIDRRANRLANHLRSRGIRPDHLVAVCMERSIEMIVAVLAVLKAGAAYVPLDPAYPADRIGMVLEDSGAELVLTKDCVLEGEDDHPPSTGVESGHLAYVIFTSGSTGRPKGVEVRHEGVVNFLRSMAREPGLTAGGTMVALTTLSFDIAGLEIFLPLSLGAKIVLVSRDTARDGEALARAIAVATCVQATPATFRMLIESGWRGGSGLKVLCGGEAMPSDLARQLLARCEELWNMYGPTETTIWSSVLRVEPGFRAPVSIGFPIANTRLHVLDANSEPVPVGVVGDLYIGGDGVARGYKNKPDLTAEKFVPDPFGKPGERLYRTGDLARYRWTGDIEFLGRADHQVKVRGFRIELGEIEEALTRHPEVRMAAVILAEAQLVAYAVVGETNPPDDAALRRHLASSLPDYMVPAMFVRLPEMPLTPNGKIDRRALPMPAAGTLGPAREWLPLETAAQCAIAEIFGAVLNTGVPGRNGHFFELGGHSLLVTKTLLRIRERFGRDLPVRTLFESPTVEALAQAVEEGARAESAAQLERDVTLDIHPDWTLPETSSGQVLLTGASGFLGTFLLHSLLEQTSASVVCLVRGGLSRLRERMQSYRLWRPEMAARIHVQEGDLAQPLLGLSPARFEELAAGIDAIYHNGAAVNFFQSYADLKPANVDGTREVLRLAAQGKRKTVHYVSTTSVLAHDAQVAARFFEEEPLGGPPLAAGGYPQSKWVAEKILDLAQSRGIPVAVYRPGTITGSSRNGACNEDDFLYRFLRGSIQMGAAPDISMAVDLLPADWVAAAIVAISKGAAAGRRYHLTAPEPAGIERIFEWTRSAGFPLEHLPYREWRERLELLTGEAGNALAPVTALLPRNNEDRFHVVQASFDGANTRAALEGAGLGCPRPTEALMHLYLDYLAAKQFIPTAMEPKHVCQ